MSNAQWFLLLGCLFLAMGLTWSPLRRLPVTSAIIYLAVGLLVGPTCLHLFHFNPLKESALLEVLTEGAALISLYAAGVKMPVPLSLARWRTPILLAFVSMILTVGLVAVFAVFVLELPLGAAILLGAIVAPTDPVLATDVQIRHPGERDRLRFTLTCEAGMNDGSAFPFVMLGLGLLGLHDIGEDGIRWAMVDVLWATVGGIGIGFVGGVLLAHVAHRIRNLGTRHELLDDFLGLGLIGVVYGASVGLNTWGFLAVFFAAVALRQTERKLSGGQEDTPDRLRFDRDAEAAEGESGAAVQAVSEESLIFKEHLERLSELVLILLVGGTLFINSWSWRAVGLSLFLFLIARPVSVMVGLAGTRTPWKLRALVGWFGVRGIGSLYYLMYSIQHGLPEKLALELIHLTLIVVTLSIVCHGISVKPVMEKFWSDSPR
ncbi:MAG TPA: cation:proton antiporter [Aromatoleum sp.]|uniref:cation:proton antiporter n=1 Tax=Aromatoleum sp. TaxID=2307007 RepID=UPI002B4A73BF|nr:cation:proton antiporter [Aromatoleum sp.]HJV27280.1 cation:proton antiporter [Aromatoleum sp.]